LGHGKNHFGNHDVGVGIASGARKRAGGLDFQEPSQFPHGEHSSLLDEFQTGWILVLMGELLLSAQLLVGPRMAGRIWEKDRG